MRRSLFLILFIVLACSPAGRAEILGVGGGLAAYPLDLRGLKEELAGQGAPAEGLARIPDFLPLPHLGLRGRLGLLGPLAVQLEAAHLGLELPLAEELSLSLGSTVISISLLGRFEALFIGLVLGIGTDLIQGELALSSSDPGTEALLEQLGLGSLPWSAATVHGLGEVELVLGPLRFYLEGRYLYPLSQSGLGIGFWEAGLGLMIVI